MLLKCSRQEFERYTVKGKQREFSKEIIVQRLMREDSELAQDGSKIGERKPGVWKTFLV